MKKILSAVISAVMTGTALVGSFPAHAETTAEPSALVNDSYTVEGTNSFGSMLSEEIQSAENSTAECLSKVISAETEGNTVNVRYVAEKNCSLVVGLYTEDGSRLIASGTTEVSADERDASVTFDAEEMPEYYLIRAYLIESETLRPLSIAYESSMYTQEMQEFLAMTVNDFDSERVLNLDEDETNNFVVFSESVIMLSEETNTLVSVDDVNDVYVFENPDEVLLSLQPGDVFTYNADSTEVLIAAVGTIESDGNTVTITGGEASFENVFEYAKIDTEYEATENDYSPTGLEEGVTYTGFVEENESVSDILNGNKNVYDGQSYVQKGGTFELNFVEKGSGPFSVSITGSASINFKIYVKYYLSLTRQYLEFGTENTFTLSAKITGEIKKDIPLGEFNLTTPIGVNVGIKPTVELKAAAEISLSFELKQLTGFAFENEWGGLPKFSDISEPASATANVKVEGKLSVAVKFEPNLNIISTDIAKASIPITITAEVSASLEKGISTSDFLKPDERHACGWCIEGGVTAKLEFGVEFSLLEVLKLKKELKFSHTFFGIERKVLDFYYSIDFKDFGFGKCPHKEYKNTIQVKYPDGKPLTSGFAKVYIDGKNVVDKLDSNGCIDFYWQPGTTHKVTVWLADLFGKRTILAQEFAKKTCIKLETLPIGDDEEELTEDEIINGDYNGSGTKLSEVKAVVSESGHAYRIYELPYTWDEAEIFCEEMGGHLMTITSQAEQDIAIKLITGGTKNSYWLGANVLDNEIVWLTGEKDTYSHWGRYQPDNHGSNENALMIYRNTNPIGKVGFGYWNDLSHDGTCGTETFFGVENFGFICEWDVYDDVILDEYLSDLENRDGAIIIEGEEDEEDSEDSGVSFEGNPEDYIITMSAEIKVLSDETVPSVESMLYTGLEAGETYNFYAAASEDDEALDSDNLLYVAQYTADESGVIDIRYIPKTTSERIHTALVAMSQTNLTTENTVVEIPEIVCTGEMIYVEPVVTVGDTVLEFGTDYVLLGNYSVIMPGEYILRVLGTGNYTGIVDMNFTVICNHEYEDGVCGICGGIDPDYVPSTDENPESDIVIGDVNGDKAVDASDASAVLAAYAAKATGGDMGFTDDMITAADVNADNAVDAVDASNILAYYAYIATGGSGTVSEYLQ